MAFNKGEWSELYTFLHLIENPDLVIVDENLIPKNNNTFKILEFILANETKYKINGSKLIKINKSGHNEEFNIGYIGNQSNILLEKILSHTSAKGAFDINEIQPLINSLLDGNKLKGSSRVKGDLEANVFDRIKNNAIFISYNIKSSLGASATLLNASSHTDFIYEVLKIDDYTMNAVNEISTLKKGEKGHATKLIDSCEILNKSGAEIYFNSTNSHVFKNNLRLIDSQLDSLLAEMLFMSYYKNEKDIKKLLNLTCNNQEDELFYNKKIGDFANAVTFGMRASEAWNGINEVNGGIIIVTKNGDIYLLDLIYFKTIVDKYLVNNIKLDSPSSKRFKMFQIYKNNNKYYFKLNLQIRFK